MLIDTRVLHLTFLPRLKLQADFHKTRAVWTGLNVLDVRKRESRKRERGMYAKGENIEPPGPNYKIVKTIEPPGLFLLNIIF